MAWVRAWSVPKGQFGLERLHVPWLWLSPSSSPLCFSCSCRNSCSPHPTQRQTPTSRRKGLPGARQASGPKASGLMSRYCHMCSQTHAGPQGRGRVQPPSLFMGIKFNQLPVPLLAPPLPQHRWPCSWYAGHFLRPRLVGGFRKSLEYSHICLCSRHCVRRRVRAGTGRCGLPSAGLLQWDDSLKHSSRGCGDHSKKCGFLFGGTIRELKVWS